MSKRTPVDVLLLGSGGRECAMAWKIAQSALLNRLFIAPGNAGTAAYGTNLDISPMDFEGVARAAIELNINLLVVGSEDPLVAGIADYFHNRPDLRHIAVVGPESAGARLEGSKEFAKQFMLRHNIPTAQYLAVTADNIAEGLALLERLEAPYVLKADGLAAGKGVLIIDSLEQAKASLAEMLGGKFGDASRTVVIEEYLYGVECSAFVLTDGTEICPLSVAKDYKRIGEGDTGPNTGGMGSVSPPAFVTDEIRARITERIIRPTVEGLKAEGIAYCGFIFFGLMIDSDGNPKVIEYNVRLGDPETESIMRRLNSDLLDLMLAATGGELYAAEFSPEVAATVMMVSDGYPGSYSKGFAISGLETPSEPSTVVFHAGTRTDGNEVVTAGGRVLAVTATGATLDEALRRAYGRTRQIHFTGAAWRNDIGTDIDNPYAFRSDEYIERAKTQAQRYTETLNR